MRKKCVAVFSVVTALCCLLFGCSVPSVEKYKGEEFNEICVFDSYGLFRSPETVMEGLKEFHSLTGIQPYVLISGFMPSIQSDDDALVFAKDWVSNNVDDPYAVTFVYIADISEKNIGRMCLVYSPEVRKTMYDNFEDKFWWEFERGIHNEDLSYDDVILNSFNKTAKKVFKS